MKIYHFANVSASRIFFVVHSPGYSEYSEHPRYYIDDPLSRIVIRFEDVCRVPTWEDNI
jgi:hypothetical protein